MFKASVRYSVYVCPALPCTLGLCVPCVPVGGPSVTVMLVCPSLHKYVDIIYEVGYEHCSHDV